MPPKPQELTAVVEHELKRRDDWCIIQIDDHTLIHGKCQPGDLIPGVTYRFVGYPEDKYGCRYRFTSFIQAAPHSRRGIIRYLEKFAPNVGQATANRLIDLYGGEQCIAILKTDPERVARDTRLSITQARETSAALIAIEGIQETKIELMDLLEGSGLHSAAVDMAIKRDGAKAAIRIKTDPFSLLWPIRFPGAGFGRVDTLYQKLGHPSDKMKRQVFCAIDAIDRDESGSTWISFPTIERAINDKVTGNVRPQRALDIAVRIKQLAREDRGGLAYYAIRRIADAEIYTAQRVQELLGDPKEWQVSFDSISSADILRKQKLLTSALINSLQSVPHFEDAWDF